MGWFGNLIGTEKAVNNVVDKENGLLTQVGGWIGKFSYTPEEKAIADKDTREWGLRWLDSMAPFKVVQRILVFTICFIWAFVAINLSVAIWIKAIWPQINAVDMFWQLALSDYVFWPAVLAFSLYLSGGVIKPSLFGKKE
jgi:hypothetical protein